MEAEWFDINSIQEVADCTFEEYVKVFIDEKRRVLGPVTVQNYEREMRRAEKYLGPEKMNHITFAVMKRYFQVLTENEKNLRNGRALAQGTLRQHYIILHSFFENAVENGAIGENPMRRLKHAVERKNDSAAEPLSYDEEQVRYILKCMENEPLMWRAAVMFAIDSGCRSGEVMGLKWQDIDLITGRTVICRNVQYTAQLGTFTGSPKNGKNRIIFLNGPVLECLSEWKSLQQKNIARNTSGYKNEGYCFTQRDGSPLIPVAFNNYLRMFGKKYRLPGIHPHALRHTMASLSIVNGADIVSVSNKLGHASTSITLNVYSHVNAQAQQRANAVLAGAIY